jgi:hypothetical protein
MNSGDLAREQVEKLQAPIGRTLRYLGKLQKRMDAVGWSVRDPLHRAVLEAFNAVHSLNVELTVATT